MFPCTEVAIPTVMPAMSTRDWAWKNASVAWAERGRASEATAESTSTVHTPKTGGARITPGASTFTRATNSVTITAARIRVMQIHRLKTGRSRGLGGPGGIGGVIQSKVDAAGAGSRGR